MSRENGSRTKQESAEKVMQMPGTQQSAAQKQDNGKTQKNPAVYHLNKCEQKFCKDELVNVYELGRRCMCEALTVAGSKNVRAFLESNLTFTRPEAAFPTMTRMCLFLNCSETFKHDYLFALRAKNMREAENKQNHIRNEDVVKFLVRRLQEGKPCVFLHDALIQYTDVAAPIKMLEHLYSVKDPEVSKALPCENRERLKMLCANARNSRNHFFGHENQIAFTSLTKEEFMQNMDSLWELAKALRCPENEAIEQQLESNIKAAKKAIANKPIPLEQIANIFPNQDVSTLKNSKFGGCVDWKTKVLYLHTAQEVNDYCTQLKKSFNTSSERLMLLEGQVQQIRAVISGNAAMQPIAPAVLHTSPVPAAVEKCAIPAKKIMLPKLAAYQNGSLNGEQFDELAQGSRLIADTSFWLDETCRHFLAYSLMPVLKKKKKRLLVDWCTRVELYQMETNENAQYSNSTQEAAHRARIQMHQMNTQKVLTYGQRVYELQSSQNCILALIKRNADTRFCGVTQDREFYGEIAESKAGKLLPVCLLPDESVFIRSCAQGMVREFCIGKPDTAVAPEEKAPVVTLQALPAMELASKGVATEDEPLPQAGGSVCTAHGAEVRLNQEIGRGGEGTVYRTDNDHAVAKIYHAGVLTQNRLDKLALMLQNNPHMKQLCWPSELLYNEKNKCVGYLMPALSDDYIELGRSALSLNKSAIRAGIMKDWNRQTLVRLCIVVCHAFKRMNAAGILMGDVNPKNVFVKPDSISEICVRLVDCDSFQIGRYPCPVGTLAYTSPEIYARQHSDTPEYSTFLRTQEDENYAIASLLFRIMMLNASPFAGKGVTNIKRAIRDYHFAYRGGGNTGADTPDGPFRLIWNNTPGYIKDAFAKVFNGKGTVSTEAWIPLLEQYNKQIDEKLFTDVLVPNRYWDTPDRKYTVDFTCTFCQTQSNMPRERWEREEKSRHPIHLCTSCTSRKYMLIHDPELVPATCEVCKGKTEIDKYSASLQERGLYHVICKNCNGAIEVTCASCGRTVSVAKYQAEQLKEKERPFLCKECRMPMETTCRNCGRKFSAMSCTVRQAGEHGHTPLCPDCKKIIYR